MNIAELSIRKRVITWVLTVLMVVVGLISFDNLAMLEDPEFTIKEAVVLTPYPGASSAEVEEEVTNVIEKAIQQLGQLEWLESRSSRGNSQIKVRVKDRYDKATLPQVWDELRRKVNDAQNKLPPGAGPSIVNDDFGDVYGVYVAITGEGYTYKEIYEYANFSSASCSMPRMSNASSCTGCKRKPSMWRCGGRRWPSSASRSRISMMPWHPRIFP